MSKIPAQYAWLTKEPGPKMLLAALSKYGVHEIAGNRDTPEIMQMAKDIGVTSVYTHDEVPWCGMFMTWCAVQSGKPLPFKPVEGLWALNWQKFGTPVKKPMLGDILIKTRKGGGHVTMYVGEDATHYHCLGANQGDEVKISRFPKDVFGFIRRPPYDVQPSNVRVVALSAVGEVNSKEA